SPADLYRFLADELIAQLDLPPALRNAWDTDLSPNRRLETFLCRHVLPALAEPLVWVMDEVDRLFACPFSDQVFGLWRSWHNARPTKPHEPWPRLTLVLAHATEPSLFIKEDIQSPFNVGTRLDLTDFTPAEFAILHAAYGSPLATEEARNAFY